MSGNNLSSCLGGIHQLGIHELFDRREIFIPLVRLVAVTVNMAGCLKLLGQLDEPVNVVAAVAGELFFHTSHV